MNLAHSRWLAAGLSLLLAASPVLAQLKIADSPTGEPANLQFIALRPNAVQSIYFSFYNPNAGLPRKIRITLEQISADGKAKPVGSAEVKIESKKHVPVSFAGIPAPKDSKDGPIWPKLDGPPFAFRFTIFDADKVTKLDVPVRLQEPREYVKIREANYDPIKQRLSFKLASTQPLDPPCPVELVLQPSAIPGLIPSTAGTFKQKLSKDNQEVELSADSITFERGVPPQNGRIYLTVDGFERAFPYKCAFAAGTLTALRDEARARLVTARFSPSAPKIPVTIEIDARGQEEAGYDAMQQSLVEVKFDRTGQGNFEKAVGSPFRGLREQTIEFKADGDALIFKTKVKDRVIELDADLVTGPRLLKVRLLKPDQAVIKIANEQDSVDEKVALFSQGDENKFAPLTFDKTTNEVVAALVFDSSPAQELRIVNVPAKARPEGKLTPKLQVKSRDPSKQAPIDKVYFFFGEADNNHKIPEKAAKIEATWDKKQEAYLPKEEMIVPAEHRGKLFVGAVVETATGASMSKKQALTVITKESDTGEPDVLTTITGQVMRGDRGQPGVTVTLAKAKPKPEDEKKTAKTTDDGKFEFADVEPGNYIITAVRIDTVSRIPLNIPKNKEKIEGVELQLKAK